MGSTLRRNLIEVGDVDQHIAGLGAVWGAKDPGEVELIDDARGTAVADAQPPMQKRRAPALVEDADQRGLAEEPVAIILEE